MSSSQQPTDPNNNNTPQTQIPNNYQYSDYEEYPTPSIPPYTAWSTDGQGVYIPGENHVYPNSQVYANDYNEEDELDDEFDANEMMPNGQLHYNDEDGDIFSDAVQKAFEEYAEEYSQHWIPNKPTWEHFPDGEEDEIFNEMDECMMFLDQEYERAGIPSDFSESTQNSGLNPDAVEFRPSWLSASEPSSVASSSLPFTANKQGEGDE